MGKPFTFSNGVQATLHPVSPFTLQSIEASVPKPTPPMQEVDHADGTKHSESNTAHPDYLTALTERRQAIQNRQQDALLLLGVQVTIGENEQGDIAAFRETCEALGIPLDTNDKLVFLKHICFSTMVEIRAAILEIGGISAPKEEEIAVAAEAFKSDAAGTTDP